MDALEWLQTLGATLDALPGQVSVAAPSQAVSDDDVVAALDRWTRNNGALPKSVRDATT